MGFSAQGLRIWDCVLRAVYAVGSTLISFYDQLSGTCAPVSRLFRAAHGVVLSEEVNYHASNWPEFPKPSTLNRAFYVLLLDRSSTQSISNLASTEA